MVLHVQTTLDGEDSQVQAFCSSSVRWHQNFSLEPYHKMQKEKCCVTTLPPLNASEFPCYCSCMILHQKPNKTIRLYWIGIYLHMLVTIILSEKLTNSWGETIVYIGTMSILYECKSKDSIHENLIVFVRWIPLPT